ncbi:peptidoglycan DD-metalloendopeptidase family protein [Streptomyces sp. NPDC057697]|uniref:peptidoglycan DD-metalloendopeptidase family protein n=1 Tax=Streptomyces sp. NPDC057697 TaxID=3346219 RepID=UPI0036D005CD
MAANGRHRRYQPSRINRASLTVTAGGAGLALPLIAATSAGAASADVWEKVAACESTGDWHINNGNGHFGGLQFTRSTWAAYGGALYAPRADLATKDQQIAIAEKVLDAQGPGAWPTCSTKAGLARDGQSADISPQSQRTGQVRTPGTPASKQTASPRTAPGKTAPGTSASGKAATKRTTAPATPTTVPGKRESYTVARGDSLSAIAQSERLRGGWQHLYAQNREVVGDDPDLILPGQRLSLDTARPGTSAPAKPKAGPKPRKAAVPEQRAAAAQPRAAKAQHDTAQQKAKPKPQPKKTASHRPKEHTERHTGLVAPVAAATGTPYHQAGSWASGYHTGVDFPVPTGTSIRAVASGTVVSAGWGGAYGYQVVIRHADGKYSQYAHLSALHVREGRHVSAGQRIARSGSTGNVTGPHLHFEVRTGPGYGSDIDPLAYLRAGGVSV